MTTTATTTDSSLDVADCGHPTDDPSPLDCEWVTHCPTCWDEHQPTCTRCLSD